MLGLRLVVDNDNTSLGEQRRDTDHAVPEFSQTETASTSVGVPSGHHGTTESLIVPDALPREISQKRMPIDALYPDASPELGSARRLLSEALERLNDAHEALRSDNLIGAHNEQMRLQALLPELFCCRTLGDGFGVSVSGLFHALENIDGPISETQLTVIRRLVLRLNDEPFLSFEKASDLLSDLEAQSLDIDPPVIEQVARLFDETKSDAESE